MLYGFRIFIGLGMALALVTSWAAILRQDIAQHCAWMLRGYAIGLGAGARRSQTVRHSHAHCSLPLLPPGLHDPNDADA